MTEHLFICLLVSMQATESQIVQLVDVFRLLGDATRLKIVLTCLESPVAVGEIAGRLQVSASLVSHHLRLLRAARLVASERQGKLVYYRAADQHVVDLLTDMLVHVDEPIGEAE
ncbi:ArsR/SmtB family transcription factor [Halothiobacillus sp. DCM-1]|uniref:ArsR/SmtB family transcription factor n=1 Tax=Halothiobacillus sp. DCM-1 TaxID=3112558 RepID=UPI003246F846